MHYSRIMQPSGDHRYFTSTAVFLNEVIKLAISATFALYDVSRSLAPQTPATVLFEQIYRSVFSGDGWKLAIPATLYTFENTLQYVALGNLDPVHFQVLYQLKVRRKSRRGRGGAKLLTRPRFSPRQSSPFSCSADPLVASAGQLSSSSPSASLLCPYPPTRRNLRYLSTTTATTSSRDRCTSSDKLPVVR